MGIRIFTLSRPFEAKMSLSSLAIDDLKWWQNNLNSMFAPIHWPPISKEIATDSSLVGWGATCGILTTGGAWSDTESDMHINVKEMIAVYFGLQSLCRSVSDVSIRLNIDNTTVVGVLKHMGTSHSSNLNFYAKQIWLWAKASNVWLFPVYVPSGENLADQPSRNIYIDAEWMLNPAIFQDISEKLDFCPEIDLFASRLNAQLSRYVSYTPDPNAYTTDAFSISWASFKFYSFPPFSCISQCLQKIQADHAMGIIVVPRWSTQPFYALLKRMLVTDPVFIPKDPHNLIMPNQPSAISPIGRKTNFLACLVSGKAL